MAVYDDPPPDWRTKEKKEIYLMTYVCYNCGHHFNTEVAKGELAPGNAGECPYCGVEDSLLCSDHRHKPILRAYRNNIGQKHTNASDKENQDTGVSG